MAAAGTCLRRGSHRRIAAHAGVAQARLVLAPQFVLLRTEKVEIVPREDAAAVAVGKDGLDGVVANRLQAVQTNLALAGLQHLLPRAVALHLRRWRIDAHQLERDAELRTIGKPDLQNP